MAGTTRKVIDNSIQKVVLKVNLAITAALIVLASLLVMGYADLWPGGD